MATEFVAVVHLPARSGIAADEAQNTFAFTATDLDEDTNIDAMTAAIQTFYRGVQGLMSPELGTAPYVKYYILGTFALPPDPLWNKLGAPAAQRDWTWSTGLTGTALPEEVAITMSLRGDYTGLVEFGAGTRPRARHRGRIYLGPLNTAPLSVDATTGRTLVNSTYRTVITDAATALMGASGVVWSIWSRTTRALVPVTAGWVDNAFDTQRRRGPKALARSTF